jgi:glyoxylase-like metal-dependent hydrolase (beta-lactamase superfamily II)
MRHDSLDAHDRFQQFQQLPRPAGRAVPALLALTAAAAGCSDGAGDEPAQASLLERVAAAMGGDAARATAVEQVSADGERYEPGEGLHPDRPLFMSRFAIERSVAAGAPRQRQALEIEAQAVLPQPLAFTEVIDGDVGYVSGNDNIFGSPPESPLLSPRVAGQLRHADLTSPLRLVRAALAAPDAAVTAPDVVHDGRRHEVLALRRAGAPDVRLLVDPETDLVAAAETIEDHPPRGDTRVEVAFADYRDAGGAMIPFEVSIRVDGALAHREVRREARALAAADDALFAVPAEHHVPHDEEQAVRARRSSQWYAGFFYGAFSFFYYDQSGSDVEDIELAPGVHYLRGPSHHNLLIEQQGSLAIVDAPMYVGRTASVLAHLKAHYPGKPLRHVIASHFHQDHVGGIREFAAEGGVTVLAGAPTRAYFESVFSNPHTVAPDRLELDPKPVTVVPVDASHTLADPARPIQLYRIANTHAEDMLIVYLPQQKLLFVADLFGPDPATKGMELPGDYKQWAAELYTAVTRLGLDVQTVVGAHGEGTATLADVKAGGGL